MTGTIKRLVRDKGFGFILAPNGVEYFFHRSTVDNARFEDLTEGQTVTFAEESSAKGPRAATVSV